MSDLVERLQRLAKNQADTSGYHGYCIKPEETIAGLALAEIERLTPVYVAALAYVRMSEKYIPDETAMMDDDENEAVDQAISDLYDNLRRALNFHSRWDGE